MPSIHWEKKAVSSRWLLGLGDGLDVVAADALVGVLREHAAQELLEGVVAHLPAEHVEDHGALFQGHGLELRGVGVEAAEGGERLGVVGQRAGGDIADGGLEGGLAGGIFEVHQLAVAGHAVGDPGVVERCGRDLGAPPLVGEGVGEQALRGWWLDDAIAGDAGHLRRPGGGDGVVGQLDDVDAAGLGLAEDAGHVLELAAGEGGEVGGAGLALVGDVDVDVVEADR